MISALGWIRRSAAATLPTRHKMTEAEYAAYLASATENLKEAREEAQRRGIDLEEKVDWNSETSDVEMGDSEEEQVENEQSSTGHNSTSNPTTSTITSTTITTPPNSPVDELAKYNMDDYDNEEESLADDQEGIQVDAVFSPLSELVHPEASSDEDDPMKQDSDEENDLTLLATDALFVAARTEDDVSHLEVYVLEQDPGEEGDNFYVHHDLMLGSFPLCVEWLSHPCSPGSTNYAAVGTFEPFIEIWNLDLIDVVDPEITLNDGHEAAVMSLAWNRAASNFLVSGGEDHRVCLWDLNARGGNGPLRTFTHSRDKVQSVAWNPVQPSTLASAAYDRTPCIFDVRSPKDSLIHLPKLESDPEQFKWHSEFGCAVADEKGRVTFFDTRAPKDPKFILDAHGGSVACLEFCPVQTGAGASIFLTASSDKTIKVWGIGADLLIHELCSKSVGGVGKVFAAGFLADAPLVIAAGGSRGVVETWNLRNEDVVLNFLK